jgi:hypothetical protein
MRFEDFLSRPFKSDIRRTSTKKTQSPVLLPTNRPDRFITMLTLHAFGSNHSCLFGAMVLFLDSHRVESVQVDKQKRKRNKTENKICTSFPGKRKRGLGIGFLSSSAVWNPTLLGVSGPPPLICQLPSLLVTSPEGLCHVDSLRRKKKAAGNALDVKKKKRKIKEGKRRALGQCDVGTLGHLSGFSFRLQVPFGKVWHGL